ncbi:MAG: hypothetical protein WBO66_00980, partial [Candidatus Moraniibacteriota bacterium]
VEVARRGSIPTTPSWNSISSSARDSFGYEEISLDASLGALRIGENVLAIHGLNRSVTDVDFFLSPQLAIALRSEDSTLALDDTTGSWTLTTGTIKNGTISTSESAIFGATGGKLDGVTLATDLTTSNTITIMNGLTLAGSKINLQTSKGKLSFSDGQSELGGTGTIQLLPDGSGYGGYVSGVGNLTIGENILIQGRGYVTAPNGTLTNLGTIRANWGGGGYISVNGSSVVNAGTFEAVSGGQLYLYNFAQNAGSIRSGTGSLVLVNGALGNAASGELIVDIGGIASSAYGRINSTGVATLGGSLSVSLVNGFEPAAGNSFGVLSFASRTGDFTAVTGT